jgi:ankyrin repeat protein
MGVEIDAKDKLGRSPLFSASQAGHSIIVKILLEAGIGRNEVDKEKKTALHFAAAQGHLEVVTLLAVSTNGENICECTRMLDGKGKKPIDVAAPNVVSFLKFVEDLDNKTK